MIADSLCSVINGHDLVLLPYLTNPYPERQSQFKAPSHMRAHFTFSFSDLSLPRSLDESAGRSRTG